jgi:oligopeptidase A
VRFYQLFDSDDSLIGGFYFDLFARSGKRGGAWMSGFQARYRYDNEGYEQLPVCFMVGNFTPALAGKPSLLTHDEVLTLFHEFGHGLHHLLTQVSVGDVAGVNGVEWDAVELPSQFMENWAWDSEGIALISSHVETGEPLPQDKLDALLAAKNFQSGMQTLRQVEFSLFDLLIHAQTPAPDYEGILATLNAVRADIAIIDTPDYNRFANGFSHIFAGGYAAGYYSYKWAELLSADAFSKFEEEGIFNPSTGKAFRDTILSVGGSLPAKTNFENFRGRSAGIDALLRHSGFDMANSKAANTQISNEAG